PGRRAAKLHRLSQSYELRRLALGDCGSQLQLAAGHRSARHHADPGRVAQRPASQLILNRLLGEPAMPESTDATRLGVNRTGLQMSPFHAQQMLSGKQALEEVALGEAPDETDAEAMDGQALSATRLEYIADADPLGSVPMPGTLKGAAKSSAKMLTGK